MAGGYESPALGDLGEIKRVLRALQSEVKEIGRPTGSQTASALATLQALVDGLLTQVNGIFSGYVQAGTNITAGGDVTATGTVTGTAGITSVGVYNLDVSLLPGGRRTNWTNDSGRIGYAPSSITKKTGIQNYSGSADAFLACQPVVFYYMGQVAIRDDPQNAYYDPNYVVPLEVGHIAQWLVEKGLSEFVFYDEDGVTPAGINYAEFAAVGFIVVGRAHEERLARLEALVL
jgi:hypothetical protein